MGQLEPTTTCCCGCALEFGIKLFCAWHFFFGIMHYVIFPSMEGMGESEGEEVEGGAAYVMGCLKLVYDLILIGFALSSVVKDCTTLPKRGQNSKFAYTR